MIEGAGCFECGRCNGGDVCRNTDTYYDENRKAPRKICATSWLIKDAGSIGVLVSNTETSTGLVVSIDTAIALVINLVRNIELSHKTTSAAKARLLATVTKLLDEDRLE